MIESSSNYGTGQCEHRNLLGRTYRHLLVLLALLILATPTAFAQLTTADIVGTVTDTTGAVISGANITLLNLDTHDQRTATASGSGEYQFTLLPVGRYSITVSVTGFKTTTTTNLAVEAGDRARSDVKLQTGGQTETVNVEAQTPLLQADSATVSSTVTAQPCRTCRSMAVTSSSSFSSCPVQTRVPATASPAAAVPTIAAPPAVSPSTVRTTP